MRPAGCRAHPCSSGPALEVADLPGLLLDPFLGSVELFLLLALDLFLATLPTERSVAGEVAGRLLHATGELVDEAHQITSSARSYPRGAQAKRHARWIGS